MCGQIGNNICIESYRSGKERNIPNLIKEKALPFNENIDDNDLPKPKEDVDFLVDDVERKEAERVVLLNLPGRTKLVERALKNSR